jgi:hypothetical protein
MKRGWLIGIGGAALIGLAALQATPNVRNVPGGADEVVDEPEAASSDPVEEAPKPAPRATAPAEAKPKAEAQVTTPTVIAATTPAAPAMPGMPSFANKRTENLVSSLTPPAWTMPLPPAGKSTAMAERVAVIGFLNKRNGLWRDIEMKPGEARRIGDVVIRLRACEKTAPWEPEQLTGAFVQLLVNDTDKKWRRYFSGWLYKESPSLNVVEHPVYDVWAKECRMRTSDIGPNTIVAHGGAAISEKKGEKAE